VKNSNLSCPCRLRLRRERLSKSSRGCRTLRPFHKLKYSVWPQAERPSDRFRRLNNYKGCTFLRTLNYGNRSAPVQSEHLLVRPYTRQNRYKGVPTPQIYGDRTVTNYVVAAWADVIKIQISHYYIDTIFEIFWDRNLCQTIKLTEPSIYQK